MEPTPASTTATATGAAPRRCENCGAQLLGEHCFACGQPTKGLVRHFSSILGDFLDSVFNFDTRTFRTLGPLLLRPGYLTNEYFHGHRVRYVSPVRLFFFLCIGAFFAVRLSVDFDLDGGAGARTSEIARAETASEVARISEAALKQMREARADIPDAPGARVGMDVAIAAVEAEAKRRIEWIEKRDAAIVRGEEPPPYRGGSVRFDFDGDEAGPPPPTPPAPPSPRTDAPAPAAPAASPPAAKDTGRVRTSGPSFNGRPWDPVANPVRIDWLPEAANAQLNRWIGRGAANAEKVEQEPRLLVDAFLGALPQMLFVLLPLFALLLKVFHLFKRRLYMEHLIVALHSHAFLCAAILLLVGLGELRDLAVDGFWHSLLGWGEAALVAWMPVYLLLMQKRVYRQGWIMTLLKFGLLGLFYCVLLSVGAAINLAVSVVAM